MNTHAIRVINKEKPEMRVWLVGAACYFDPLLLNKLQLLVQGVNFKTQGNALRGLNARKIRIVQKFYLGLSFA